MRTSFFLCIIIASQQFVLTPFIVSCELIEEPYSYNVSKIKKHQKFVGYPMKKQDSGWSSWKVGAAVLGVASLVAAPFVAPAVAGAVGFTSVGIAKGSTAAYLMSLSGGATKAGSLVAIGQSVGAAGISTSTTLASGVVGSVVGGTVADGVMGHQNDSYIDGGYEYWTETTTETVWDSYTWEKCNFQE